MQAASIVKLPSVVNAPAGLVVTETLAPPIGTGPDSAPRVNAFAPPAMVEIGAPDGSVTLNEASGGTTTDPPGWSVNGVHHRDQVPVPAARRVREGNQRPERRLGRRGDDRGRLGEAD